MSGTQRMSPARAPDRFVGRGGPTVELLLSWDETADPAPMPSWKGTVRFIPLVLALSAIKFGTLAFERLGTATPGWWPEFAEYVGGSMSTVWALLVVGALTMGWPAVGRLLRTSLRVRVDWRLYAAAVAAPVVLTALAAGLAALLTGTRPALTTGETPPTMENGLVDWLQMTLLLASILALTENLGWRAWLQRGLQRRQTPLVAGIVVGIVWALWHWPMTAVDPLFAALPFTGVFLAMIPRGVLTAALFNASKGTVMPVVVAHLMFNVSAQMSLPPDPADAMPFYLALTGVGWAATALVIKWTRSHVPAGRAPVL